MRGRNIFGVTPDLPGGYFWVHRVVFSVMGHGCLGKNQYQGCFVGKIPTSVW
jgi:hypothetical protein